MTRNRLIEYHHEFLYFNAYVRENGCTPKKHPHIWFTPENKRGEDLSLYEVCNILLFDVKPASRKAKPWPELVTTMLKGLDPHRFPPELFEKVDVNAWLEYARSLDIEGKLDRYLPKIFNAFGNTFEVPVIKVSPVRLNPCPANHFRAIASGSYNRYNITNCDPAFYNKAGPVIYFPIPETAAGGRMPEDTHDMTLMHEVVHASIMPLYGGLTAGPFGVPENLLNRAFSEVFSTLGAAYAVYGEVYGPGKKKMPKRKILNVAQHLCDEELFMQAFIRMAQIGFENTCRIVAPALGLTGRIAFLDRELSRIDTLTEKQMRGILTKRYAYKKQVSGMGKKALKNRLLKHGFQRLRALFDEIGQLQIHRLFAGAASGGEFTRPQQKVLLELSGLFGPQNEAAWAASAVTCGPGKS